MTTVKTDTIRLHPDDNVVVARVDIAPGDRIENRDLRCLDPIPAGHKAALRSVSIGNPIIKYGQMIGFAGAAIRPGEHVHTHKVMLKGFRREIAIGRDAAAARSAGVPEPEFFNAVVRPDGRVTTRNYIAILPPVNCSTGATHKPASNSPTYRRLADHMDVNCGEIIVGDQSIEQVGELIFQRILETASGRRTLSEQHGFGEAECVPWQFGAVL
jgi:altronate dehydratase